MATAVDPRRHHYFAPARLPPRRSALFVCLGFSLLLTTSGCSSFERQWKAAVANPPADPTDITGQWKGRWVSDASGHNGGLRCVVTRTGAQTYSARFRAAWGWIFRFEYELPLVADRRDDAYTYFHGEADLGWPGVYRYEGKAGGDEFICEYETDKDYGTFTMTRPAPKE